MNDYDVTTLFEGWVERHVVHGEELDPAVVCADQPEELLALQALIVRYRQVSDALDGAPMTASRGTAVTAGRAALLPALEGFRTIERIGVGGMGEVYKLQDLKLGRFVAAKVLRADRGLTPNLADFLSEARTLALFQDRRIVQIHELRDKAVPPVLIMEYVDGFELGRLAPSIEYHQRARIVKEVCEVVHQAHQLGVQHRDLKPSNIMLDAQLQPKILDFGLSSSDPAQGHFRGTPQYLAPEQLDPSQPIDARTDVYALGAVLYELLTGVPPVDGPTVDAIVANVRAGAIRLPVEIAAGTPEPLQAIALKALETRAANRYASAQDMALDLGLYLSGRPVTARPSRYTTMPLLEGLNGTSAARTGVVPKPGRSGAVTRGRAWAAAGLFLAAAVGVGSWLARNRGPTESAPSPRLSTFGPASSNAEANRHFIIAMERVKRTYDIPRAREALDRALAADPRFAEARAWKAFITFLSVDAGFAGDSALLNEAEEEMRHALRDEPTLARAHLGIAALYLMQGRRDMMPAELDQVLKGNPNDENALFFLMQYHHYAGEYVPALDLAARILDRSPLFWPARINFGHILQQQGNITGGRLEFGKILEEDPLNPAAHVFLARTYIGSGDLKEARRSLDRVAPEHRQTGHLRLVSATLLAREGHREQALRAMDQDLLKWGALVAYWQADFAAFYAVLGDAATALDWLDRAVRGGDERAEWFRGDPLLANIRDHPRFKQIMETIAYRRQQRKPVP